MPYPLPLLLQGQTSKEGGGAFVPPSSKVIVSDPHSDVSPLACCLTCHSTPSAYPAPVTLPAPLQIFQQHHTSCAEHLGFMMSNYNQLLTAYNNLQQENNRLESLLEAANRRTPALTKEQMDAVRLLASTMAPAKSTPKSSKQ